LKEKNMRRLIALLLPPAILVQACAGGAPAPPVTSLDAVTLSTVNRAIEGQPVALQLASGEVVREVEGAVMTAESTSWLGDGDRVRSVPTSEVCKVIRQVRHRAGKGYAWGLVACLPVAAVAAGSKNGDIGSALEPVIAEALCALLGMVAAAGLKLPRDRVVYSAPRGCGN
jgi:hypothetical protein